MASFALFMDLVLVFELVMGVGLISDMRVVISTGVGVYNYDVDWDNDGIFDELGVMG